MPLTLACPSCSRKLQIPDTAIGKKVRCPRCQTAVSVPDQSAVSPEAAFPRKRRLQQTDETDDVRQPDHQQVEDVPTRKGPRTRPASKPVNKVVLIGGAVLLAALVGVGIWLATRPSAPEDRSSAPVVTPQKDGVSVRPQGDPPTIRPDQPPEAQAAVDAPPLLNAYLSSNIGATEAYTGKILDVRGAVLAVRRDESNRTVVDLNGVEARGLCVQCVMAPAQEKAAALKKGQQVTIRGRCDGKGKIIDPVDQAASVVVTACWLIEVREDEAAPPATWIEPPATAISGFMSIGVSDVEVKRVELFLPKYIKALGNGQTRASGDTVTWSRDSYLAIRLSLRNVGGGQFLYKHPTLSATKLTDDLGNEFQLCQDVMVRKQIALGPGSRWEKEQLYIRGQQEAAFLQAGDRDDDLLLFSASNLRKGRHLLLELPGTIFTNHLPGQAGLTKVPDKIRFRLAAPVVVAFTPPQLDPERLQKTAAGDWIKALQDMEPAKRYEAAHGLALAAPRHAATQAGHAIVLRLSKLLASDNEEEVRAAFAFALGEFGGEARAVLTKKGVAAGIKGQATVVLNQVNEALMAARTDGAAKVRAAAEAALKKSNPRG